MKSVRWTLRIHQTPLSTRPRCRGRPRLHAPPPAPLTSGCFTPPPIRNLSSLGGASYPVSFLCQYRLRELQPSRDDDSSGASMILACSPTHSPSLLRRLARKLASWARSILDAILVASRAVEITLLLSPLTVLAPASIVTVRMWNTSTIADLSWRYALLALHELGPAFVKLAQWAATRRDLFPPHFCDRLGQLHDDARVHRWEHTHRILTEAFGDYEAKGLNVNPDDVVGSGSAAQVYKATLRTGGSNEAGNEEEEKTTRTTRTTTTTAVAVKVLHPDISRRVERDLNLLTRAAKLVDSILAFEAIRMLSLPRAAENFASVLRRQVDLTAEGRNLEQFRENFTYESGGGMMSLRKRSTSPSSAVTFPRPMPGWIARDVLVETYVEDARPIADFLKDDSDEGMQVRKELAGPLLRSFLKMVFIDNFTHCDLHPGNVLVQTRYPPPDDDQHGSDHRKDLRAHRTICFLDAGLAISLSPNDRRNLLDLFRAVLLNDGERAGRLMVERARYERCSSVPGGIEAFSEGVGELVSEFHDNRRKGLTLGAVRIGSLLGRVLDLCRVHGVEIDPAMANVVLSTLVLEGLGRSLHPDLNLLDFALPFVLGRGKV